MFTTFYEVAPPSPPQVCNAIFKTGEMVFSQVLVVRVIVQSFYLAVKDQVDRVIPGTQV